MSAAEELKQAMVQRGASTPIDQMPDTKVDMFSARGFALANRIAQAFANSDAIPAQFRLGSFKKINGQDQWVENSAALGNCIVAIEVAQAVGMSVTAVMQNADVIEGKLRWSDRFVVGGINASKRFTPLRFDVKNLGTVEAKYKEKGGWNKQKNKYDYDERSVTVDNFQSIAWALPYGFQLPAGVYTLDQAKAASLPVIEGPPVSMKLAVEEGWYAKPGSKWQTELKHKMLMMRSGRFFGDIHAPDIVMGIGRTSDEEVDIIDVTPQKVEVPEPVVEEQPKQTNNEILKAAATVDKPPKDEQFLEGKRIIDQETTVETESSSAPSVNYPQLRSRLEKAEDVDMLDADAELISLLGNTVMENELQEIYKKRREELTNKL